MKELVFMLGKVVVLILIGYSIGHRYGVLDGITAAGAAWLLMPWDPKP